MKFYTFIVVLSLIIPAVSLAQSGPPAQNSTCREEPCNYCANPPCEKSVPDVYETSVVPTAISTVDNMSRMTLLQVIINLMSQLQDLLTQLRNLKATNPSPQSTPALTPSPYPPQPDEVGATCYEYTYDSCPLDCIKKCIVINECANPDSDTCGEPDCNGEGSCYFDPTPRTQQDQYPQGGAPCPAGYEDCQ